MNTKHVWQIIEQISQMARNEEVGGEDHEKLQGSETPQKID